MGLRVNSNIASLNAQRSLSTTTERLQANYRRLSTGLRISTASDDAAGLASSERFRAQVRCTTQALRNATPMWGLVVWGGVCLALGLTAWGLWQMELNPTYKAFLGVCWLFLISSVFTLAKTLRDAHEAALAEARAEGRAEMQ